MPELCWQGTIFSRHNLILIKVQLGLISFKYLNPTFKNVWWYQNYCLCVPWNINASEWIALKYKFPYYSSSSKSEGSPTSAAVASVQAALAALQAGQMSLNQVSAILYILIWIDLYYLFLFTCWDCYYYCHNWLFIYLILFYFILTYSYKHWETLKVRYGKLNWPLRQVPSNHQIQFLRLYLQIRWWIQGDHQVKN